MAQVADELAEVRGAELSVPELERLEARAERAPAVAHDDERRAQEGLAPRAVDAPVRLDDVLGACDDVEVVERVAAARSSWVPLSRSDELCTTSCLMQS